MNNQNKCIAIQLDKFQIIDNITRTLSPNTYVIKEKDDILKIISDHISRKIISSIQRVEKSASQISTEQNIELSMVYRRLRQMQRLDMLKISFQVTPDGKKSYYYKSKIEGMDVRYHQDIIEVEFTFNHILWLIILCENIDALAQTPNRHQCIAVCIYAGN